MAWRKTRLAFGARSLQVSEYMNVREYVHVTEDIHVTEDMQVSEYMLCVVCVYVCK